MFFYALENKYGSSTNTGLGGADIVIAFKSRRDRDEYVNHAKNLSVRPINADTAKRLVKADYDGKRIYHTADGDFVRI